MINKKYKEWNTRFKGLYNYTSGSIVEVCPHCDNEVELKALFKPQKCPKCSVVILPCSMCIPEESNCVECSIQGTFGHIKDS